MKDLLDVIREKVIEVAIREDIFLSGINEKGIFWMPEVAFVSAVWKELLLYNKIDKKHDYNWKMEKKVGNAGGPVDLVAFEKENPILAIEFKLGGSCISYRKDIRKLRKINGDVNSDITTVFCALIDPYEDESGSDTRVKMMAKMDKIEIINDYHEFQTAYDREKSVSCKIGLWKVLYV